MSSARLIALCGVIAATCALPAQAEPISFSFVTGTQIAGPPAVAGLFAGPVSGTLVYDSAAIATGPATGGVGGVTSGMIYGSGALLGISGSVDGRMFADTAGGMAIVANEGYNPVPSVGPYDLMTLAADPFLIGGGTTRSLSGFDIAGYTLVNVRLFWIESVTGAGSAPDFLADNSLPATLPTFSGRLAFDFMPVGYVAGSTGVAPATSAFFDGLLVTRQASSVPEPATMLLLATALLTLAWSRRRQRLVGARA